uniref:Uncharacterized protein n=1 Tax=Amphimedon queenslandica TaxID=400682 RepID=A0A1X7T9B6_AMPQE
VRNLELEVDQISKLRDIANELQEKYDFLVPAVKESLESNRIDVENAKLLIKERLKRKAHVVPILMPCIGILERAHDFESFFKFLSKYNFIGYLNYKLLKALSQLVKDDE